MHDTRSVRKRDVLGIGYIKRLFFERTEGVREHRLVFGTLVRFAFLSRYDFVFLEKSRHESLGEYIILSSGSNIDVIGVGVHTERDVRRERPGRSRPYEEISILFALYFEFDINGFFFDVFIPLSDFVRR